MCSARRFIDYLLFYFTLVDDFPRAYKEKLESMKKDENYAPLISLFSPAGTFHAGPLRFDRTHLNAKIFTFGVRLVTCSLSF